MTDQLVEKVVELVLVVVMELLEEEEDKPLTKP